MVKKTWKIGESCLHGILSAETKGNSVQITLKNWSTKEVKDVQTFTDTMGLMMHLTDVTTSYHADKVKDWVKKNNVALRETSLW